MKPLNDTRAETRLLNLYLAIAQLGWPRQLALVLMLLASICLTTAWQMNRQAQDLRVQLELAQILGNTQTNLRPTPFEPSSIAPEDSQFIKDLELLFQIGMDTGVSLASIDYKSEFNNKAPLNLRTLDLRVNEDYPKIKGFISRVLRQIPNAALQEIRIERKDVQTTQGSMLLKLTLVYQTSSKPVVLN